MGVFCLVCGDPKEKIGIDGLSLDGLGSCRKCGSDMSEKLVMDFSTFQRYLQKNAPIRSEGSGKIYSEDELEKRSLNALKELLDLEKPEDILELRKSMPSGDARKILRNWLKTTSYDFFPSYKQPGGWNSFTPVEKVETTPMKDALVGVPFQGWKIHVSSYPFEARNVLKELTPFLKKNDICFKAASDVEVLEENNGKLMTIYPRSNWNLYNTKTNQLFVRGNEKWNFKSMNSNILNALYILAELNKMINSSDLSNSFPNLEGSSKKFKYEKNYGGARLFYRYSQLDGGARAAVLKNIEDAREFKSGQRDVDVVLETEVGSQRDSIGLEGRSSGNNYKPPSGIRDKTINEVYRDLDSPSLSGSRFSS